MNGRTPTKAERRYGDLCQNIIGCIACRMDRNPMEDPNETWIAFHHDPDYGSKKPNCHFHASGLCVAHHQGINNRANLPVRHPTTKQETRFQDRYGSDEYLCKCTWKLINHLPPEIKRGILEHCPFDELWVAA